tara:strand:- start:18 stop:1097 length:1080 start_codon:yes stop_codon:yes gene_type:complete
MRIGAIQNYKNEFSNKEFKEFFAKNSHAIEYDLSQTNISDIQIIKEYTALTPTGDTDILDLRTILRTLFTTKESDLHSVLFLEYLILVGNSPYYGSSIFRCSGTGTAEDMQSLHKKLCDIEVDIKAKIEQRDYRICRHRNWLNLYKDFETNLCADFLTYSYLQPCKCYPLLVAIFDLCSILSCTGHFNTYPRITCNHAMSTLIPKPDTSSTSMYAFWNQNIKLNTDSIDKMEYVKLREFCLFFDATQECLPKDLRELHMETKKQLDTECKITFKNYIRKISVIKDTLGLCYNLTNRLNYVVDAFQEYSENIDCICFALYAVPAAAQLIAQNQTEGKCVFSSKIGEIKICSIFPHIIRHK